jgi:hypothetical protein
MRAHRKIIVAISAAIAAAGLVLGLLLALRPGPAARPAAPPRPLPRQLVSPFTGEPIASPGPVVAVKIDNIVWARPQTGLSAADIVYVLPVEGGLSRFLAIFSSRFPPVIGPVRSAREDDLELLRQFGRPAFAYSGAQPQLLPVVERARTVDLYSGRVAGYYRDQRRIAPYNLYARTRQLRTEARRASRADDIGFRFGPAPPGGRAIASEAVSYAAASFTFTWSAGRGRWLAGMDGSRAASTDGGQLSAATVVFQYTVVRKSRYIEWGALPPYADSTGSGPAVVLRNGKAYQARWSRPSAQAGTTFSTPSGQPMTFAPGPVWIILTGR